ncbi:asparaginase domain-containing protein [Horticoccus sp. 23ND18S-11]|uniref:asparaginase domain-containing protein n=1 Tax=Horticoccus sp. 23ND18S-11 TaxID=3391832 RepID=UPI0039C91242
MITPTSFRLLCAALSLATSLFAADAKPRIAVFSGPTATIQNSRPLVTSNKARAAAGLPLLNGADGKPLTFDELYPQRVAAPVTVYVEQFTAHPLESDAAKLYAAPDGYVAPDGSFAKTRRAPTDKPVYAVTLKPEDGVYPLPFMGRQADGSAWDSTTARRGAPFTQSRQTFYPNAARILEEIERAGGRIYEKADFDFYRPAPSGGYTQGLPAAARTDAGDGDIVAEKLGEDFFTYGPYGSSPSRPHLARATNIVQRALASGKYAGAVWLEGSPSIEDTVYWLGLLIDTAKPIVGNSAQRARGLVSADGDANIIDSIGYITSGVWRDTAGRDRVGAVTIMDQVIYNAREVQKGDARPGGYVVTGGFGGIVGTTDYGPKLTFLPVRKSTHRSDVRLTQLPATVAVVARTEGGLTTVPFATKDAEGNLLPAAIPAVTIVKSARWQTDNDTARDASSQVEILARLDAIVGRPMPAGLVSEGLAPYGSSIAPVEAALDRVVLSGIPVVQAARGDSNGYMQASPDNLRIESTNLTATKSRILLMACLLKFGALPPAKDPTAPTPAELAATKEKLKAYQAVFDTH